jgi:hypothetical protein
MARLALRGSPRSRFRPEGSKKGFHTCPTFENLQVDPKQKAPLSGAFAKSSDGLEPSTPSSYHERLRQPVATHDKGFGLFWPRLRRSDLPPIATGCNHGVP